MHSAIPDIPKRIPTMNARTTDACGNNHDIKYKINKHNVIQIMIVENTYKIKTTSPKTLEL